MAKESNVVRLDKFGRIKLPSAFRRAIEESGGDDVFVALTDDRTLKIYPLAAWHAWADKLLKEKKDDRLLRKFLLKANHNGHIARVDRFGKVQIPGFLRKKIKLEGEIALKKNEGHLILK